MPRLFRFISTQLFLQIREIKSFVLHENWCGDEYTRKCGDLDVYENDIAILRVNESFHFNSFVQPACLPTSSYQYQQGSEVVASGFGANNVTRQMIPLNGTELEVAVDVKHDYPDELQAVKLPLIETQNCAVELYYPRPGTLPDNMVCAGYEEGGKDSCGGDSGGPLIQFVENRATLIGVVSWGYSCAMKGAPGVYAKVAHFADWIDDKIKSEW